MKKTVAVIGAAGTMGSSIAKNLATANYKVILVERNEDKLKPLVDKIRKANPDSNVQTNTNVCEAAQQADIIIPAIWYNQQGEVANQIKDFVSDKIVISISNPLNETYDGLVTEPNTSAAEDLAKLLPSSKVVKAFNTTFAADFQNTILKDQIIDSFVAGDDDDAVEVVHELVKDVGFNPLNAGKLSASRTLENMMVLLIGLSMRYDYNWLAGWKILTK